jgi:hypothetical protein
MHRLVILLLVGGFLVAGVLGGLTVFALSKTGMFDKPAPAKPQ